MVLGLKPHNHVSHGRDPTYLSIIQAARQGYVEHGQAVMAGEIAR
jgi:hypothetical protein